MTSTQLPGVARRLKKNAFQAAYRARKKPEANSGEGGGFAPGVAEQIEAEAKAPAAKPKRKARKPEPKAKKARLAKPKKAATPKAGESRTALCLRFLTRAKGATVAEIMETTGWLPHTTRAFISATIGKKLGHTIESEKVEGRGRVYRIAAPEAVRAA